MLKYLSLFIAGISYINIANACQFIENAHVCSDKQLSIMDRSLQDLKLNSTIQNAIKYGLTNICKNDLSCIHETLAYQLQTKGKTLTQYNITSFTISPQCINIYTLYPEQIEVIFDTNTTFAIGTLNEDIFKDNHQLVYIRQNMTNSDKNICRQKNKTKLTQIIIK